MSLFALGSLMHLNSKDNSHYRNYRSVPILFLFFVAEVLRHFHTKVNHPAKSPLP